MSARILFADIETMPLQAYAWGLRDQNIGLNQIITDPAMLGVGYKRGSAPARYVDTWGPAGRTGMLTRIRDELNWAQAVVHYNGDSFDMKWINAELDREQIEGYSPVVNIDLYKIVRNSLRLPSYKLSYVAHWLGVGSKVETGGFDLWKDCMNGDPRARKHMGIYCKQDTNLLEPVLDRLRHRLPARVNLALLAGIEGLACPACESLNFHYRGNAVTSSRAYPRCQCQDCGKWFRDNRSVGGVRGVGL